MIPMVHKINRLSRKNLFILFIPVLTILKLICTHGRERSNIIIYDSKYLYLYMPQKNLDHF